jgi:hypothetical protein
MVIPRSCYPDLALCQDRDTLRRLQKGRETVKHITALLAAAGLFTATVAMAAPDSPSAPARAFISAFNKGDLAGARAAHETNVSIMDEMPPHIWQGPTAFDEWVTALTAYGKAHGRTNDKVTLGAARVATVAGDRAYVVITALYTYADKGQPIREPATMTFAVHRGASGWKIAGWSWNGTVPQRARQ